MSEGMSWWEEMSEEEIALELAEEARQHRLAEECYRELLALGEDQIARTDEF